MPTPRHGKGTRVFHGAYDLSLMLREATVPRTMDTPETTAFGSAYKTYVAGNIDAKANASGMFAYNGSAPEADIDNVLAAAFGQETPYGVSVAFDNGVTAGKPVIGGAALQSNYTISGSHTDIVGVTADWQYTGVARGGLCIGVGPDVAVAMAGSDVSATGVDYSTLLPGAATQFEWGGMAVMHLVGNTIDDDVQVVLQSSATLGGVYVDFAEFAAVATLEPSGQTLAIASGVVIDKFIRYQLIGTGTGNAFLLTYFAPATS